MEDRFKTFFIGFVLFCVFGYVIVMAILSLGTTYDKDLTEFTGSSSLNIDRFNSSINSMQENAETITEKFRNQNVFSVVAGIIVNGIFGIGLDLFDLMLSPFDIILGIMTNIFHISPVIVWVFIGIGIIVALLGIWRLMSQGD